MKRIAIIGNGGGGKTTLSRRLKEIYQLPLTHVDSIQFLPGMKVRAVDETRRILNQLAESESWIIDGFGPLDVMLKRFQYSDKIIFVDFPLWRHYWWCTKRQFKAYSRTRSELPLGCDESGIINTFKLYKTLWRVHSKIRPLLLDMFSQEKIHPKVIRVTNLAEWNHIFKIGLS